MTITPTPLPPGARRTAATARALRRGQTRHAAIVLIAHGLDEVSGPWPRVGMARDIAEALGLLPTVTRDPARQHGEGTRSHAARVAEARETTR